MSPLAASTRDVELGLVLEVAVQRALRDARAGRDLVEIRGHEAVAEEDAARRVEDALALDRALLAAARAARGDRRRRLRRPRDSRRAPPRVVARRRDVLERALALRLHLGGAEVRARRAPERRAPSCAPAPSRRGRRPNRPRPSASSPISAPSSTIAPIPISAPSRTVQPCTTARVADRHLVADQRRVETLRHVHDAVVLQVRARADADRVHVAAHHGAEPAGSTRRRSRRRRRRSRRAAIHASRDGSGAHDRDRAGSTPRWPRAAPARNQTSSLPS